jgi:hypothetical protein
MRDKLTPDKKFHTKVSHPTVPPRKDPRLALLAPLLKVLAQNRRDRTVKGGGIRLPRFGDPTAGKPLKHRRTKRAL